MRCLTTLALAAMLSSAMPAEDPLTPDLMRHTRSVCDAYGQVRDTGEFTETMTYKPRPGGNMNGRSHGKLH